MTRRHLNSYQVGGGGSEEGRGRRGRGGGGGGGEEGRGREGGMMYGRLGWSEGRMYRDGSP